MRERESRRGQHGRLLVHFDQRGWRISETDDARSLGMKTSGGGVAPITAHLRIGESPNVQFR